MSDGINVVIMFRPVELKKTLEGAMRLAVYYQMAAAKIGRQRKSLNLSVEFRATRLKLCGNCAFPQNFHTRKLSETTVFYSVRIGVTANF